MIPAVKRLAKRGCFENDDERENERETAEKEGRWWGEENLDDRPCPYKGRSLRFCEVRFHILFGPFYYPF